MERYTAVAKENWKHNMPIPLLVCTLLLLGSPFVVGIENLTEPEVAKVTEYYLVFLGIILLPPVFLAEQNRDIRELVTSKYTPVAAVYSVRIVQAILSLKMCIRDSIREHQAQRLQRKLRNLMKYIVNGHQMKK